MFHILKPCDQRKGPIAKVEFEGELYGAGISFFHGNLPPSKGPGLHKHPYPETYLVLSGQAAMVVDGEEVVVGTGDIVVIGPATPHRFTAIGDQRLEMVCVHASGKVNIESLRD
jgi:mannose-6-phosphate isomerase-like protein (cupin superfamily)